MSLTPLRCSYLDFSFSRSLDDAGHVHLEDGVDVRAGALRLDHALRDDGAHLGHRDEFAGQRLRLQQASAAAGWSGWCWSCGRSGDWLRTLLEMADDVRSW